MTATPSAADLDREATATERRARELSAKAQQQRDAHTRQSAAEQAARDTAAEAWWEQQRAVHADPAADRAAEEAWSAFAAAVRDDGDVVGRWRDYRRIVRRVADNRAAVAAHFAEKQRSAIEQQITTWRALNQEARILPDLERQLPAADFRARLAAWLDTLSAYTGRTVTEAETEQRAENGHRMLSRLLPDMPSHAPTLGGAVVRERDVRGRADSFAAAVDMVVADIEQEAVTQARADRAAALEGFVTQQTTTG